MLSKPRPYKAPIRNLRPYDLKNVGWAIQNDPRWSEKFQYLANIICAVGDIFYVRNDDKEWEPVRVKGHAVARVFQEHGGVRFLSNGQQITLTLDDVKAFMATGIQSFAATTYAPGHGDFVVYAGSRRLNMARDRRMAGNTDDIAKIEEYLKVIRNSLCNASDEIDLPAMLDEITGKAATPFRWVMHWLACRYQRPGYTTQTNLWFCGRRGTGKGTLLSVMRQILGSQSVSKIDKADIARGWTDSMFGADLVEWDEFKGAGWHDFSTLIKEKTGNESFIVTSRNIGGITQPAVAFHVFATNERLPVYVEKDDRQNSFIATTQEQAWSDRAAALFRAEDNGFDEEIISGFAALLNTIEVDLAFIRKPIITALRDKLADHFADTTLTDWIDAYLNGYQDNGYPTRMYPSWEDLHRSYISYVAVHCQGQRALQLKPWKALMVEGNHAKESVGKDANRKSLRYVKVFGHLALIEEAA